MAYFQVMDNLFKFYDNISQTFSIPFTLYLPEESENISGHCQNMKTLPGLSNLDKGSVQSFKLRPLLVVALSNSHLWLPCHSSATSPLEPFFLASFLDSRHPAAAAFPLMCNATGLSLALF